MWVKGTYSHPCSNKKPRPLSKIYVFILVFTFAIFLNETCNWILHLQYSVNFVCSCSPIRISDIVL